MTAAQTSNNTRQRRRASTSRPACWPRWRATSAFSAAPARHDAQNPAEQPGVCYRTGAPGELPRATVSVVVSAGRGPLNQPPRQPVFRKRAAVRRSGADRRIPRQQPANRLTEIREKLFSEFQPAALGPGQRIALIGLRGAGKALVGRAVGGPPGAPFIELNEQIEREAGLSARGDHHPTAVAGYRKL